jgi:hypothetical protein
MLVGVGSDGAKGVNRRKVRTPIGVVTIRLMGGVRSRSWPRKAQSELRAQHVPSEADEVTKLFCSAGADIILAV